MSEVPATITVDSSTILAALAIVYGGMAAAIGYLWRGHQEMQAFIRDNLLRVIATSTHREKVHHWLLSRLHPDLMAEAEREVGDLEAGSEANQTATLPAARPVGHGSRKRPGTRSGEHRVALVLVGILQWAALAVCGGAGLVLLAACAGVK